MDLSSHPPARLIQLATSEYSGNVKWWSTALNYVSQARQDLPDIYQAYLSVLELYLPRDEKSVTGFAFQHLNNGQRLLQMFLLDVFADNMLVTLCKPKDFIPRWQECITLSQPLLRAIEMHPELIDLEDLDRDWNTLRAAIS